MNRDYVRFSFMLNKKRADFESALNVLLFLIEL
jgi:hypothetical protein